MSKTHRISKIRKFETFCNTTECAKHKGFRQFRKCRKFSKFYFWKCQKHIGIRKFENSKHFATLHNANNIRNFDKFENCRSFRNLFFENVFECSSSYVFVAFCKIKFRKIPELSNFSKSLVFFAFCSVAKCFEFSNFRIPMCFSHFRKLNFEKFRNFRIFRKPLCFLHSVVLQNVSDFRIFEFLCVFHIFENSISKTSGIFEFFEIPCVFFIL